MNNSEDIYDVLKGLEESLRSKSEQDIYRELHNLDSKFHNSDIYKININEIIINIGSQKRNIKLIYNAISRLKKLLDEDSFDKFFYDIGNAYLSIGDIDLGKNPKIDDLLNNKEYQKARIYFSKVKESDSFPYSATNTANILEKYGRNYEAILMYDKALKYSPNFGMALGNKGISLKYYFNLTNRKDPKLILYSRELIKRALEVDNTISIGGQGAIDNFKKHLELLDNYIKKNKIRIIYRDNIEPRLDYLKFCMDKNLFLNYCFNCYRCEKGFIDNFSPTFISFKTDISKDDLFKYGSFPKKIYYSIKILNQIIEDYSTARHIYYQAMSEDFHNLDKISKYYYALDYCRNSLKYGYIKTSYIKLFNILDKIAHLIYNYYELDDRNVYFRDLLDPKFKDIIKQRKIYGLLALHNLAMDFQEGGIYYKLNKVRNYLTHDFIDMKEDLFDYEKIEIELFSNHQSTEKLLCNYLNTLFIVTKAALIYFVNALYSEIKKEPGHNTLKIYVHSQEDIFGEET